MQISKFPMKSFGISATYNSTTAHKNCSQGKPCDYPTDLCGKDTSKEGFYAPVDCKVIKVYNKASNGIWLKSTSKVKMPIGEYYLFMMLEHPTKLPKLGQVFKQGELVTYEDRAGNASGNHIHLSCGYSKSATPSSYWQKNSKGAWVCTMGTQMKIQDAFFLDKKFTKVYNNKGITFKET